MRGYLQIIRPLNVGLTFLTVIVAGYLLDSAPPMLRLISAALSAALIAGFGNAVNDAFDIEIDRMNRPSRPLPSGMLTVRQALTYSSVLAGIGLVLSWAASRVCFVAALGIVLLLFFYAIVGKRIILVGNLTVAAISGATFLYPSLIESVARLADQVYVILGAVLGFAFHLAREILKDAEDLAGDNARGVKTLAGLTGRNGVRSVTSGLMVVVLLLVVSVPKLPDLGSGRLLAIAVFGCLLGVLVKRIWYSRDSDGYGSAQRLMKYLMPVGLLLLLFLRFTD